MKNKAIALVLLSTLLTSCIAVVVAGAAGGMVVYDRRSVVVMESDARIFYKARTTIVSDPRFRDARIVVTSFNEVVLLTGQTPSGALRQLAESMARKVPNVKRVYNEITVQAPITFAQRSQDTWITSQVRAQMLTQKGLESGSIRVVTENSIVYLMGIVSREQAELAVSVARQVSGVTKVVKVFQYISIK